MARQGKGSRGGGWVMKKMLNKKEKQLVRKHFGDDQKHPLLMACDEVFASRAGRLVGVKANGEEVFCEVASLADYLMEAPNKSLHQNDIDKIYTGLVNDYREWEQSTPHDREIIADTVFRIVRQLMCHYCGLWQSDEVYVMMDETLKRESRAFNEEELNQIDSRLLSCSEMLDAWVNQDYDGHFWEKIEAVIKGKPQSQKPRSGRKAIDLKEITASFKYLPKANNRTILLKVFYDCLRGVYIEREVNQKLFIDVLSGTTTTEKITWIRGIRELHYLIDKLEELTFITWPSSYGKWQMVCARFNIRIKKKEAIDDRMSNDSFVIESLTPNQFTKDGGVPDSHDELDRIIRILNPKYNVEDSLQSFMDEVDEKEHDMMEDYCDALANDLQIVSRL